MPVVAINTTPEKYVRRAKSAREINQRQPKQRGFVWWLKQLIPRTQWGIYLAPEGRRLVIWKSWLGKEEVLLDIKIKH